MVFRKQQNNVGNYKDTSNVRFDVLYCERCESMEWYDTGEVDEQGEPIWAQRVVINKGWDKYPDLETAVAAYGLTYDPMPEVE